MSLVLWLKDGQKDLSPYEHALTYGGGMTVGKTMEFNGSSYMSTGSTGFSYLAGTFSSWIKADDWTPVVEVPWNGEVGVNVNELKIDLSNNNINFIYRLAAGATTITVSAPAASLPNGSWHHIVTTWIANGLIAIYVDGVLVDSDTAGFSMGAIANTFYIGADAAAINNFNGEMHDIKIDNTAWSADAVAIEYKRERERRR